jgi:hypothetical protein
MITAQAVVPITVVPSELCLFACRISVRAIPSIYMLYCSSAVTLMLTPNNDQDLALSCSIVSDHFATEYNAHCSNSLLSVSALTLCYQSATPLFSSCLNVSPMVDFLILTLFSVALLYGIYLPIYVASMRVLLQPSGDHALKTTTLVRRTFLVTATLIFILETLCVVFELGWCLEYYEFLLYYPIPGPIYNPPHNLWRKKMISDIVQVRHLTEHHPLFIYTVNRRSHILFCP